MSVIDARCERTGELMAYRNRLAAVAMGMLNSAYQECPHVALITDHGLVCGRCGEQIGAMSAPEEQPGEEFDAERFDGLG